MSMDSQRLQSDYQQKVREYWTLRTWKKFLELTGRDHSSEGYAEHEAWYQKYFERRQEYGIFDFGDQEKLNLPVINKEKFPDYDGHHYREYDFGEACCPVWKGKARPDWNPSLYRMMFDKDQKLSPYFKEVEGGFTLASNNREFYSEAVIFGSQEEDPNWREEERRQEQEFLRLLQKA